MNRELAALNQRAADLHAMDKVGDALLRDAPEEPMSGEAETGTGPASGASRRAFVGLADEIRDETTREASRQDELARKVWNV
jgi:hypothetical protein